MSRPRKSSLIAILCLIIAVCMFGGMAASRRLVGANASQILPRHSKGSLQVASTAAFPFHSQRFADFVSESRRYCGVDQSNDFYKWFDDKYEGSQYHLPGTDNLSLTEALKAEKRSLASISDREKKSQAEIAVGERLHRLIKNIITKFSLERGFEFSNVVRYGERQCFLQSVTIAGLLQEMGVNAGVVMVYRNPRGEPSNNGHAIVLVKLPNGKDTVVDASDPEAFIPQQGLFIRSVDYQYVNPVYNEESKTITSYKLASNGNTLSTSQVLPLDYDFLHSQFWYYRGERAPGGVFIAKPTKDGLQASIYALRMSVKICPKNPLSVYMLGRAYWDQGNSAGAKRQFNAANQLYKRFGWVPSGEKAALALVR